jgi:hypothetical protein
MVLACSDKTDSQPELDSGDTDTDTLPSSADENHRARPFAPQDELQTGSELG